MDVVIGGFVSAVLAWLSIFLVVFILKRLNVDVRTFRLFGGMAIATIAMMIAGASIPSYIPLLLTATGLTASIIRASRTSRKCDVELLVTK